MGTRQQAENAKAGLRQKFNQLQFVQKAGWGRPPKLIKETFKFDSGIGEVLKIDAQRSGVTDNTNAQQRTNGAGGSNNNMNAPINGHRTAFANTTQQQQQPMNATYGVPAAYAQHQYHPQYAQSYPPPQQQQQHVQQQARQTVAHQAYNPRQPYNPKM